jgi:RNA polymerase sigma-70 factor (ECF subfamily)
MASAAPSQALIEASGLVYNEPYEPTDLELIDSFREGDTAAFETVFQRHHYQLRSACLRTMGDEASADDMVQETIYRVLRSIDRLGTDSNFAAWVHRIAANVCTDELRRRQLRLKREATGDEADMILRLPDTDALGQPETALEIQRLRRLIWQISRKLPERQRMVLAMRELDGRSYASIARVMGISESAVETLLHRARRRFREEFLLLEGPVGEEGPCALVVRLLNDVGLDRLQSAQRKMVEQHVTSCSWCNEMLVIN